MSALKPLILEEIKLQIEKDEMPTVASIARGLGKKPSLVWWFVNELCYEGALERKKVGRMQILRIPKEGAEHV